jgi:acyl carrier protein
MNDILSEKDNRALLDILVEQLGVLETQLTPEARFKEDLGADSLTIMEIAMAVEERFNLSIPDEAWDRVATVEELFETVAELLPKPARGLV